MDRPKLSEEDFEFYLADILADVDPDIYPDFDEVDTVSFQDAGVLTMNKGLVVRLPNGQKFQVTIVEDRR
jgi:hypothetical protein